MFLTLDDTGDVSENEAERTDRNENEQARNVGQIYHIESNSSP